jgi:MFS family permease
MPEARPMPTTAFEVEQSSASAWPSAARAWTAVGLLVLASIASQFDRVVINLMVEPLKLQFALDDTRFAALQGVAFGVLYTLMSVPIGRLADRHQRRYVIGGFLALFSLFSMASGLARSYAQLFMMRIGVAVGEASVTPTGLSILSDLFPPERLGRAIGAFFVSAPVGMGLAFIFGGQLLQWLTTSSLLAEGGLLAGFRPWQAAFLIIGFPGLLLVPAFLLMREPERRGAEGVPPLSIREVLAIVGARKRALIPMFAGFSMVTLVSYAYNIWAPALFIRTFGWNAAQIGLALGLVMLSFGTTGTYFAGWLSDRLTRRGHLDAQLKVAVMGFAGAGIFGALAPLMPTAELSIALVGPAIFLSNMPYPCAGTAIQLIVPNRARAQVTAIYITIITLVGMAAGPMIIGLMTDYVFRNPADIRYSLAIVVAVAVPVMCTLLALAFKPYRELRAAQ